MSTICRSRCSERLPGTVNLAMTRPLSYSPQMTSTGVRAAARGFGGLLLVNLLGPFDGAHAVYPGCAYLPVYLLLEPSENIEPLLSGGVVDERRKDYQRLTSGGGGIDRPVNHPERQDDRDERHQDDDGSRYPDTQTPAAEKGRRRNPGRFFGQSHRSGRDQDYLGGDGRPYRDFPGYGRYGG